MIGQPCRDRGDLPVRQKLDDLSPLEVTDNRAVTVVPAEREVVDADGHQGIGSLSRPAPDDTEQRVVTDRHLQTLGEAGCRTTAERKAEMMDNALHPAHAPRSFGDSVTEAFGKYLAPAGVNVAPEATVISRSRTTRPAAGKSVTPRMYRLCTRLARDEQEGHAACQFRADAVTTRAPSQASN